MTQTLLVNAQDIPVLALDFMNHDHAEAVEMVNALYAALETAESTEIDAQLDQLYIHNAEHFAREEQHMQAYGFPPYPVHKSEHDRVLSEMKALISYWKSDRDKVALGNYLQHTFVDWFNSHLMSMDRVTAVFVASQMAATT